MSNDRSQQPDSPRGTDEDPRSDIQQAVESRSDAVDRAGADIDKTSPLSDGGPNGAGGVVKNQEDMQQ